VLQQCTPEGGRRQKRGSIRLRRQLRRHKRTGMPHIRKDRGQADLRRVETGTSPQYRIKSYIRYRVDVRISDDRALKVARALTPGDPLHLGMTEEHKIEGCGGSRTTQYGPVHCMVWEGGAVRLLPIPICDFRMLPPWSM